MVRIIFRHVSGSRATQVDVIPMGAHQELILGRAPSAAVRFDPDLDHQVGRHHARISPSTDYPGRFLLVDLESRNGTYVNGERVQIAVFLRPGDRLQLGTGGPELEFQVEQWATASPPDG